MSLCRKLKKGGLIPSFRKPSMMQLAPLRDGPDVSWLSKCRVGDNQGNEGACGVFAIANWAEIMFGKEIIDMQCLDLYANTIKKLGRADEGLTFKEAFDACSGAGWLPGKTEIKQVGDLSEMINQPLLFGVKVNGTMDHVNEDGCLDHSDAAQRSPVRGYHALCSPAHGTISSIDDIMKWVYIEQSWGLNWGWNGIGIMSEDLFKVICSEIHIIV